MKINRKKIFNIIKLVIVIYCLIGTALYYIQERFLFHPEPLKAGHVFQFAKPFEEIMIPLNKEDSLSVVKFLPPDSVRRGVVLYYHGNMKNVEHYAPYAEVFLDKGYEVWMGDYPGFGKTTGERTEKKMYDQSIMIYDLAATKYGSDSIFIYGKSLGTGIAAYVASYSQAKVLILETPYYSMTSLFRHYAFMYPVSYMSKYKLPLNEFVQEVKYPVVIFHGTGDDVIPYSNAKKLQPLLKQGDKFITIKGGGHNTLWSSHEYKKVMDSLFTR